MRKEGSPNGTIERIAKKKEKFIKYYILNKCNIHIACQKTRITRGTYRNWCHNDPEFKERLDDAEEALFDWVEDKLLEQIDVGELKAIMFFLKTKAKSRGYIERNEYTGSDNGPLKVEQSVGLSDFNRTLEEVLNKANNRTTPAPTEN